MFVMATVESENTENTQQEEVTILLCFLYIFLTFFSSLFLDFLNLNLFFYLFI